MKYTDLAKWLGKREAVALDPVAMQFAARPAPAIHKCAGCAFDGQFAKVCRVAGEVAKRAGLPDCEAGRVVYVLRESDPRQAELPMGRVEQGEAKAGGAVNASITNKTN